MIVPFLYIWLMVATQAAKVVADKEPLSVIGDIIPLNTNSSEDIEFVNSRKANFKAFAEGYGKRYEVRMAEEGADLTMALQAAVPITSCHDSTGGSGGAISFAITVGITPDNSVSGGLAMPILNLFTVSGSFDVSRSYSVSATYSCTIPKGSRGQIWAAPFAILGSVQHRVHYTDSSDDHRTVSTTDWSAPYVARIPSAVSPMFSCRTDRYVACTIPVPRIEIDLL